MDHIAIYSLKEIILRKMYQLFPFNINGDLEFPLPPQKNNFISCLICTAREPELLEKLLTDITEQTLNRNDFEIVLLDNTLKGIEPLIKTYSDRLSIRYIRNISREGLLGSLRNETLKNAQGEYILFLDDDTRLIQKDFLKTALTIFQENSPDVIMPFGKALRKDDYSFLDPYSFATRCILYKRISLETIGGNYKNLITYDDIDLGIRLVLKGVRRFKTDRLEYEHPPLFFDSLKKPLAIGQSIFELKKHYPWYMWTLLYLNALRFLPLGLLPTIRNRQWFKISLGVLLVPFLNKRFTYLS